MSGNDARRAAEAAERFSRCLRAWRRLGVTSRFLRESVERAEAAGI